MAQSADQNDQNEQIDMTQSAFRNQCELEGNTFSEHIDYQIPDLKCVIENTSESEGRMFHEFERIFDWITYPDPNPASWSPIHSIDSCHEENQNDASKVVPNSRINQIVLSSSLCSYN